MYTKGATTLRVVAWVYVDDLIIIGARLVDVDAFKEEMRRLLRMSDLGLLSFYLGLEPGGQASTRLHHVKASGVRPQVVGKVQHVGL